MAAFNTIFLDLLYKMVTCYDMCTLKLLGKPEDYPKILYSEDKKYELKIEGIQGWGGYTLKYYWKAKESKDWITKEDAYLLINLADGDCHGYYKVYWKENILMFCPYSDYDDIFCDDIAYDVVENRDKILSQGNELIEHIIHN